MSVLGTIITVLVIVYALKAFRKDNGGFMSLGESLKVGLAVALISGIIYAIFNYLFVTVIEPDYTAQIVEFTREQMLERNPDMPEDQMDMALTMTERFSQPWIMTAFVIIGSLFFGFIISLIAGLIMKRSRPQN